MCDRRSGLTWFVVLCAALVVRLPGMTESIWLDEVFCSRVKIGPPVVLARTLISDYHPPAYFLFQHLWIRALGDSEVAMRLPALLASLGAIPLLFALAKRVAGPRAGWIAAALLVFSPAHVWFAHEARPYSATLLAVLAASYAWLRLADVELSARGIRRWSIAFAACLLFAVLSHYFVAAFLVGFVAATWFGGHRRRRRVIFVTMCTGVVLSAVIALKSSLAPLHTSSTYLTSFTPSLWLSLHTEWFWTGRAFSPRLDPSAANPFALAAFAAVAVTTFAFGANRLLAGDLRRSAGVAGFAWLILWASLPLLLIVLPFVGFERSYVERSALPTLPFFLLVVALGLDGLRGRIAPALRASVIAVSLVATTISALRAESWTVALAKPDWRSATQFAIDRASSDGVREVLALDLDALPMSYYDDRVQLAKLFQPNDSSYARLRTTVKRTLGEETAAGRSVLGIVDSGWRAESERIDGLRSALQLAVAEVREADVAQRVANSAEPVLLVQQPWRSTLPTSDDWFRSVGIAVVARARFRGLELLELKRL